jgi:tetratricopeptide (TPR) repeat protein
MSRATFTPICLAILVAVCGCRGIGGVKAEPRQPLALTPQEAAKFLEDGRALFSEQPRTLERVAHAAQLLEQSARALRDDYDAQWQAAEALAFLAENDSWPAFRKAAAQHGIVLARRARELKPDRVEGHYWYAIDVGLLADVDRTYGLNAVGEMNEALKCAIELDERYDFAGSLRLLAILHLRSPAPPMSIGSPRKGLRLLQHAVELFPDYPENYLYLAEALRDTKKPAEARKALDKVLQAPPWPDQQFESAKWKQSAQKLLSGHP